MKNNNSEILFTYKNSTIRKSDLLLLNEGNWLNDSCLAFYLEYLNDCYQIPDLYLIDPSVSILLSFEEDFEVLSCIFFGLDLTKYNYFLFPINDNQNKFQFSGGTHWSLLVFEIKTKKFFYLDSMKKKDVPIFVKKIAGNFKAILFNQKMFLGLENVENVEKLPNQKNNYDCGIFLLYFVDLICNGLKNKQEFEVIITELEEKVDDNVPKLRMKIKNIMEKFIKK